MLMAAAAGIEGSSHYDDGRVKIGPTRVGYFSKKKADNFFVIIFFIPGTEK